MTQTTTFILGATIGLFLGVFGVILWHFNRPAAPPMLIRVEET